mmetsp:Transcript_48745/g.54550  ORF Transcript_48745/g.54550 Transcript_48745/m.54550 type:complete len:323 (-) Transcript_48745:70-1038(-)
MVFDPSPRSEWTMIAQGAEARVWKLSMASNDDANNINEVGTNNSYNTNDFIVCKERFSKAYRHPDLDTRLTKSRCRSEAKILVKCSEKSKIRVPKVIRVSPPSLYLEYLSGPSVKSYLHQQKKQKQKQQQMIEGEDENNRNVDMITENKTIISQNIIDVAQQMGQLVGRLHNIGIIHGDLTTSNMMVLEVNDNSKNNEKKQETTDAHDCACYDHNMDEKGGGSESSLSLSFELSLIDFGLSKTSFSAEEQAVDLYVLERALQSTHPDLPELFFNEVLKKYSSTRMSAANNNVDGMKKRKNSQTAIQRLEQVRMRGRKRECFG